MSRSQRLEILEIHDTPIGRICLRRRELISRPGTLVTEITVDGMLLMSSYHTASERALASRAIDLHPGTDLRVLVGGLGLGHTTHELLGSPRVRSVEVVELLPEVISWYRRDLIPLSPALKADPRLEVVEGDVLRRLEGPPAVMFDLVALDVDHSPGDLLEPANRTLYCQAGLRQARAHLAPGGVIAVWSTTGAARFERALRRVFPEVRAEKISWWNDLVDEEVIDELFLARRE